MSDVWEFGAVEADSNTYADGTIVPHYTFDVLLNGKVVGEINVHMHKRRGKDTKTDMSFGFTAVTFGPMTGGN